MPCSQNSGVLESCHSYRIRIRSQNNCLVRAYPSYFSGRVVNQAEAQVSDLNRSYEIVQNSCANCVNSVFDGLNFFIWFILMHLVDNLVEHSVSMMVFSNLSLLISAKIGIPSPPNLGGSAINFLSISLQKTPPMITGMNSDCTTSSKRLNCVNPPEIVRM